MINKTLSTTHPLLPNRLLQPAHPAALGAEAVRQYCDFVFLCRWQGCHDDDPQDLACGKLRVACAPLWVVSINGRFATIINRKSAHTVFSSMQQQQQQQHSERVLSPRSSGLTYVGGEGLGAFVPAAVCCMAGALGTGRWTTCTRPDELPQRG